MAEIRRLEKDFTTQKSHLEDEVTCLKERVKYLEEEKGARNEKEEKQNKAVTDEVKSAR